MKEIVETKQKDREAARQLAQRYHYEFVELKGVHLDLDLFHSIQVDLMFRYNFVPLRLEGNALVVAVADPSDLVVIDEVSALLGRPLQDDEAVEVIAHKLDELRQTQDLARRKEAAARIREPAKGKKLGGLSVRQLIDEGRRF